jgi:hypothetical protein
MFLRCLQFSYTGGLIQKVGGCWQDIRQRADPDQPNGLRRYEGLGFRRTMETYGYAWFLDKVDWNTLTLTTCSLYDVQQPLHANGVSRQIPPGPRCTDRLHSFGQSLSVDA